MTIVGLLTTNQQGHLKKYGNVWYQPKAISNILSMSNLKKKNSNMYDSKNGDRFIVRNTRPGGHDMILKSNNVGINYKNMRNTEGLPMLNTVVENRKHYTEHQYERAKISIEIYQTVGHPSNQE